MNKFSDRLTKLMLERGLSQSALAQLMGIGQSTVSGWTKGAVPQPRMMQLLAANLSVPVEYLRDGTGPAGVSDRERALAASKKAGGANVRETAAAYRSRPRPDIELVLGGHALNEQEVRIWAEMKVLRREIEHRLNEAVTDTGEDRRLRLHNRIDEYFATCGGLSPKAAGIMKEELKREGSKL